MSVANPFAALANIAEEKIREAQKEGMFDDLPGKGAPIMYADESHIPAELRMAYHILKNANCLPPEVAERKEIANLADLLDKTSDEHTKIQQMRKLETLVLRAKLHSGKNIALQNDDYLDKILDRIQVYKQTKS